MCSVLMCIVCVCVQGSYQCDSLSSPGKRCVMPWFVMRPRLSIIYAYSKRETLSYTKYGLNLFHVAKLSRAVCDLTLSRRRDPQGSVDHLNRTAPYAPAPYIRVYLICICILSRIIRLFYTKLSRRVLAQIFFF